MSKAQRTVLIVDDAKEDRLMIRRALRQDPAIEYHFLEAETGAQALACLQQQQPDCLLLDYHLPDTSGLQLLQRVVQSVAPHSYPIVMLTGASNATVAVQALQQGAHDFLSKHTFAAEQLQRVVNNVTEKVALLRQLEEQRDWFRLTLASISDGVITTDTQGCITWLNPVAEALTGWSHSAAHGQPLTQVFVVQTAEAPSQSVADPISQVLRAKTAISKTNAALFVRAGAHTIPIDYSAAPIQDHQGKLRGVVLTLRDVTERKAAEEQLRFHASLLDHAHDAIVATDVQRRITVWNQGAERMFGWRADEVLGRPSQEALRSLLSEEQRRQVLQALTTTGVHRDEITIYHRDGTPVITDAVNIALRDPAGQITGYLGINRDITERKVAEDALRESEARLRLGMAVAGVAIAEIDYTTNMITLSPEAATLYGLPAEPARVARTTVHDCFHPDDRAWLLPQIEQVLDPQGSDVMDVEHRIVLPDGTVRWLQVRKQVFFIDTAQGERRPLRSLLAAIDITARKAADEALRQSEKQFATMFQAAPFAITLSKAPTYALIEVNQAFLTMFGFTRDEVIGKTEAELNMLHDPQNRERIVQIMQTEGAVRNFEYTTRNKAGAPVILSLYADVVTLHGETGVLTTIEDITARKAAEAALRASEAKLKVILDNVPAAVYMLAPDHRYLFVNRCFAEGYNQTEADIVGLSAFDRFSPEVAAALAENERRVLAGRVPMIFEEAAPRLGQMEYYTTVKAPMLDEAGEPYAVIGISLNITDRKRAEEEVQRSRHLLQRVAEASPDDINVYDLRQQRMIYSNRKPGMSDFSGGTVWETTPAEIDSHIHPDDVAQVQTEFQRIHTAADDEVVETVFRWCYPDGEYRWLQDRTVVFARDEQGAVTQHLSIATDITERKRAEDALSQSEERLRLAVQAANFGIFEQNLQTGDCYWSPQLRQLHGLPLDIPLTLDQLVAVVLPADQPRVQQTVQAALDPQGDGSFAHEFRVVRPDNQTRWLSSQGQVYFSEGTAGRQPVRVAGVTLDITPRKQAELNQQFLLDLNVALRDQSDPALLAQLVVERLGHYLGASRCRFNRIDLVADKAALAAEWLAPGEPASGDITPLSAHASPAYIIHAQAGHTLVVEDAHHDERSEVARTLLLKTGAPATIRVPCLRNGDWVASLHVLQAAPRRWRPDEVQLVESVVQHFWPLVEKVRAEEELRRSEATLRLALAAARMATFEYNAVAETVQRSPNAALVQGLREQGISYEYFSYLYPADREPLQRVITGLTPTQASYEQEYRFIRPDNGATIWLLDRAQAFFDEAGALQRLIGVVLDITERKQAEAVLQRYQLLARHTHDVILLVDPTNGQLVEANQAAVASYGYDHATLLTKTIADLRADRARADVAEQLAQADTTGILFETLHRCADGSTFPVEISSRGADIGDRRLLLHIVRNITERKAAELALHREAERRALLLAVARLILESAEVGPALTNLVFRKVAEHLEADVFFNYELQADGLHLVASAGIPAALQKGAQRLELHQAFCGTVAAIQAPLAADAERILTDPKGEFVRNMGVRAYACHPLLAGDGRVLGTFSVASTRRTRFTTEEVEFLQTICDFLALAWERRQAVDKLRASEALFRQTFAQAPVGVGQASLTGQIEMVNPAFCRILGYTEAELIGRNLREITVPDDQPAEVAAVQQAQRAQQSASTVEKRYRRKDDSLIWVNRVGSIVRDSKGQPLFGIAILEDITTRKQQEEELRQLNLHLEQRVEERTRQLEQKNVELERSNKELEKFAYVASHDLRSPLRAIDNLSKWIEEDAGYMLPDASKEHLSKMRGRVRRMDKLLDDLLAFSRIGRFSYNVEPIDLKGLLENLVGLLNPPPAFRVIMAETMPKVRAQRVPLELVLRNLVGNAIKHHDRPDGSVQIAVQEEGDWLHLVISDDGPGIDPQFHAKIFEIFQTLKPRDQVEGSGMGLAIVKKAIEIVGGTITVESTLGTGATFHFTWPKEREG